jgi:TPP-dependent indolepyruvate ferredoxin oxidoreductase alpha subunit
MSCQSYFTCKEGRWQLKQLLTGNASVATSVSLCNIDYIPAFPITPQTEIIELLSKWSNEGRMDARLVMMESEHSMITAAGAAAVAGARTFTLPPAKDYCMVLRCCTIWQVGGYL